MRSLPTARHDLASGRPSQRTYRAGDARTGPGTADRICLAAEAVAGVECNGSAVERAETRRGCEPPGCFHRRPGRSREPMGPQPDTNTSAPEVWHGVLQILAPIFVARLLATYLASSRPILLNGIA